MGIALFVTVTLGDYVLPGIGIPGRYPARPPPMMPVEEDSDDGTGKWVWIPPEEVEDDSDIEEIPEVMSGSTPEEIETDSDTEDIPEAVRPPLAAAVLRGGDAVMSLPPRALIGGGAVMSLSPRALLRGGVVMSLPLRVLKGGDAVRPPLRVLKGGDAARPPPQRVPLRGGEDVRPAVTLTVNICAKWGSQSVDGCQSLVTRI